MASDSPDTPAARKHVAFRVGPAGYDWLETVRLELGCDRTLVLRSAMALARRHEAELKLMIKEQM